MAVTVFKETSYQLSTLVDEVVRGEIALPDIQRPFVWKPAKVRDLFDSLYRGFPVGHLLFWSTGAEHGARQIGSGPKQAAARLMIVDGQQRLTSLYSVLTGRPIVRDDYTEARLRIAFRPRTAKFEVTDAAIERDPEFIADISELWSDGGRRKAIREYLERLEKHRSIDETERERLEEAADRLFDIRNYRFTTIELNSDVEEEQVADIFVRINSEGVRLSQADFVLTLMSVWWEQGRKELETFAQEAKLGAQGASPKNPFIDPSPDQLLRVIAGLAFRRGRINSVYQVLRGRDIDTGEFTPEIRERQFEALKGAQRAALDLTNWHEFLKAIRSAGYRSRSMITSENNLLFAYLFYLIGRTVHGMEHRQLREVIATWFFMSALTGRYTGSFETQVEADLRRIATASNSDEFAAQINAMIDNQLTKDYWGTNLPNSLDTSAAYSPTLFAYHASLVLLEARPLFSRLTIAELMDPSVHAPRSSVERHHLFPKAYLARLGYESVYHRNQIANYAFVEWPDNAEISDRPPSDYFPELFQQLTKQERERASFWHALPDKWYEMDYESFLAARRTLIAQVIRAAFDKLRHGAVPMEDEQFDRAPAWPRLRLADLLNVMETSTVEFKASAYFSYKPEIPERVVTDSIIKTVAGFLNAEGGTLAIGVADDGQVLGIGADLDHKGLDTDRYINALTGLLERSLGGAAAARVQIEIEQTEEGQACLLHVPPSEEPVYASVAKGSDIFFVRVNNSTRALVGPDLVSYIRQRWP